MKKTLIITILMLSTAIVNSQTLIKENKTWNVIECLNFGRCQTQTFLITGDTVIEQIEYKKLYSTFDTTLNTWYKYGAIRENKNKIYLYFFENQKENILYDFNLTVGDTFSTTYNSYEILDFHIKLTVTSIDTVTLENGEQKQRFNFAGGEQWITGVGSIYGLVNVGYNQCVIDLFYDLSCCHENNQQIYQSPSFNKCFLNTVGVNNHKKTKHSVSPNPFSQLTKLTFDYCGSQNYILQIFNKTGQIVMKIKNINSGTITINGNNLQPGIYFYRLSDYNKEILNGKLIKQ